MFKLEPKDKRELLKCALGKIEADTVVTNCQLVNVITGEIYPADVYIFQGFIAHVEAKNVGVNLFAKSVIDGQGQYLIPGLIDSHMHIESSMMTPRNLAKGIINHGSTTIVTDPHEIGNVYGIEGVRYMHDSANGLPMRQLVDIPSCVPAVPNLENASCEFFADEVESLIGLERVIGLAEVMDFLAVMNGEDRMMDIIDVVRSRGLYIQGHAPFVTGRDLSAYSIGGPKTCHESRLPAEFLEKMRIGMFVDARESSITKNMQAAVEGTKDCKFFDHFCICTDDREAHDIINVGHLNDCVRQAIRHGMDPVTAIKSATYNTAREIKLENIGAIAPGYVADMLLIESLEEIVPSVVIFEGEIVSQNGKLVKEIEVMPYEIETRNSVKITDLTLDKLTIKAPIQNGKIKVNVMTYENLDLSSTYCNVEELDVVNGVIDISNDSDLNFVSVINRHGKNNIGQAVVRGYGINRGSNASTVSHDCHNLTVVYDTPENGKIACDALIACGGGMAVACDNELKGILELPVAGLMSTKNVYELSEESKVMKDILHEIGLGEMENPLLRIVTMALPVIPLVKMSDLGMVDVLKKELIPMFVEN